MLLLVVKQKSGRSSKAWAEEETGGLILREVGFSARVG